MQKISFIIDNVLEVGAFKKYQEYLQNISVYRTLEADDKKFFVTDVPFGLQESIVSVLSSVHHKEIKVLLSTIRKATKFLDKDWGILKIRKGGESRIYLIRLMDKDKIQRMRLNQRLVEFATWVAEVLR